LPTSGITSENYAILNGFGDGIWQSVGIRHSSRSRRRVDVLVSLLAAMVLGFAFP